MIASAIISEIIAKALSFLKDYLDSLMFPGNIIAVI